MNCSNPIPISSGASIRKYLLVINLLILSTTSAFSQPIITQISPVSGPQASPVIITGANFSAIPSGNTVYFGPAKANVTAATPTALTVSAPIGANGQPISVTVNGKTASSRQGFNLTNGRSDQITSHSFSSGGWYDLVIPWSGFPTHAILMVSADFDMDGKPDVAAINHVNSTHFSVLRNTGTPGNTTVSMNLDISLNDYTGFSGGMAVGDVDGDGKPDLAVSYPSINSITIYSNTSRVGAISFSKSGLNLPEPPGEVRLEDMDGDGLPELIIGSGQSTIRVYRNISTIGNPQWALAGDFQAGASPINVAVADIDGDGLKDILTGNTTATTVSVLRNTSIPGTISFASVTQFSGVNSPNHIAVADLNGDGAPEVVVTSQTFGAAVILKNTSIPGTISFGSKFEVNDIGSANGIRIADLTGEGKPDLIIASNTGFVSLQNIGTGGNIAFGPVIQNGLGFASEDVEAVDLNLDGRVDVLVNQSGVKFCRNDCGLPFLDGITPTSAGYGQRVSIKGSDFNNTSAVLFGNIPADSFRVVSNDSIVAYVSNGGSGDVKIKTPMGEGSLSGFVYNPIPFVTKVSTLQGKVNDTIQIEGYSLADVSGITIGGQPVASFTIHSATSISVVVGQGSSGDIVITNPSGQATVNGFIYTGPPIVASFTPTTGSKRTAMVITGKGFTGATSVTIGGVPVDGYTVRSKDIIDANLGDHPDGEVSVTTPYGTGSLAGFTQTATFAITSFSPAAADSGKIVSIYGSGFVNIKYVAVGGYWTSDFTVVTPNLIRVVVPKSASGNISVMNNNSQRVDLAGFVYTKAPNIESISPYYGSRGATIRLVGSNFTGSDSVKIAGVNAQSFVVESDAVINAIIGNVTDSSIYWPVRVTSPMGSSASYNGLYAGPVVLGLSNTVGQAGTNLTINGANFGTNNTVFFGGIKATISAATATAITVKIPLGGYLDKLTVLSNNLVASSSQQFLPVFAGKDTAFTSSSFTSTSFSAGGIPKGPVFADFDGDGLNDMALVQNISWNGGLSIFRNTTRKDSFSFATRIDLFSYLDPQTLKVVDMDADGKLDVVLFCNGTYDRSVYFYRNISTPGKIQFEPGYSIDDSGNYTDITLGDYDGDGKMDYAVSTSYEIRVFKNISDQSGLKFVKQATSGYQSNVSRMTSADFDSDGKTDLAWTQNYESNVVVWKNMSKTGTIAFGNQALYSINGAGSSINAADMNNDGKPDLVVGRYGAAIAIFRNNSRPGNISFTDRVEVPLNTDPEDVTIADFNGDGKPDITVAAGKIVIAKNKTPDGGRFDFAPIVELSDPNYLRVASVDLNADGKPDFAALSSTEKIKVFINNSTRIGEPEIKSFAPAKAYAGDTIFITGLNFSTATKVAFGDTTAAFFQIVNDTLIKAVVNVGASGKVSVTNSASTISKDGFQIYPKLISFSPTSGRLNDIITITGTGLDSGIVTLGGANTTLVSYSSTKMDVKVTGGYSGFVKATIGGVTDSLPGFTFLPGTPVINSFIPDTVSTLAPVQVKGKYFLKVTGVSFGGVPADSFRVINNDSLVAYIGLGTSGQVTVTTATGSGSAAKQIVCLPPHPVVYSFSPVTGRPGTTITINGVGFSSVPDSNFVYFGPVKGNVIAASATTLQVQVPLGATYDPLSVTANGLTGYASRPFVTTFTSGDLTDSSFRIPATFATGNAPNKVLVDDVNGDGNTDVLVVNTGATQMSVIENTSSFDSLSTKAYKQVNAYSIDAYLHDLDGDGRKDLLTQTDLSATAISWTRNISTPGNAAFDDIIKFYFPGYGDYYLATGDIDGDGHPDFVLADYGSPSLSIGHFNGNNNRVSFEKIPGPIMPYNTYNLIMGDVDGDGKPDLITTYHGYGTFSVFRNTSTPGAISWAEKVDFTLTGGGYFNALKMADLDGDGKMELVIANPNGWLNVFQNNSTTGNIVLKETEHLLTTLTAKQLAIGDLTGDGKPEMVLADSRGTINVFQNTSSNGNITFAQRVDYNAGVYPAGVAMADMNNDGRLDLVISNFSNRQFSVMLNKVSPAQRPVITSFAPDTAKVGDLVKITGKNLSSVTAVNFGNLPAGSFDITSDSTINAIVGIGKSGKVSVIGTGADAIGTFTYIQPPVISGFTPALATQGDTIIINGKGLTNISSISFGATRAASYSALSDTRLIAIVGTGTSGDINISGIWGNATMSGFTYHQKPLINSFSPATAAKGETVRISGKNMSYATDVRFGNMPAESFVIASDSVIIATVGDGASGAVKVTVAKSSVEANGFTFIPAPVVLDFQPRTVKAGDILTITGQNFQHLQYVYLGNIEATEIISSTATQIQLIVNAASSGNVSVVTTGGTAQLPGLQYEQDLKPAIYSFTPTTAARGTVLNVSGKNFTEISSVTLGNVPVISFDIKSDTLITLRVGEGASGALRVSGAKGTDSLAGFTYLPPVDSTPVITSFYPAAATKGTTITIEGQWFFNVTGITVGGVPASSFSIISPNKIEAIVGEGTSGNIEVSTTRGIVSVAGFTYLAPLTLHSFNPTAGGRGTSVAIVGTGFNDVLKVTFADTIANSFVIINDSTMMAIVGNGGTGNVQVTTAIDTATLGIFTYLPVPDPAAKSSMRVYPNPVSSGSTIRIDIPVKDKEAEITLVDMNGSIIQRIKIPPGINNAAITLGGMKAGSYRIVWRTGRDRMSKSVIIID